jgi:hypothetical protein
VRFDRASAGRARGAELAGIDDGAELGRDLVHRCEAYEFGCHYVGHLYRNDGRTPNPTSEAPKAANVHNETPM